MKTKQTTTKKTAKKATTKRVEKTEAKALEFTALSPAAKKAKPAKGETKSATLQRLIERKGGATAGELQKAAGWQAHSVRGFITAVIRQKMGLNVVSAKNEAGERVYSIAKK